MNIERIFARIAKSKYFSSIDLKDAYYQIPLAAIDQEKTAFSIYGMGTFCYLRMPQGLINSGATLCQLVESMFNIETEPEIFVYVDDFIICSDTFERHIDLLKLFSERIKRSGLAIGLKISNFCMKRLKFLGHIIDETGISIDESRIQAITSHKTPTNVKEIRSFLGKLGWHRKFIEDFAEISAPLVNLTKKSSPFIWTPKRDEAFDKLKLTLKSVSNLCNPDFDMPFFITAKSSNIGIGAVLYQLKDKNRQVIAYMSVKLNELQQNDIVIYPVERECLALILALEKFRHYIQGHETTVLTDHSSLSWLKNCQDPTGRIARWALRLQAYDFALKSKHISEREPAHILSTEFDTETPSSGGIKIYNLNELSISEYILNGHDCNGPLNLFQVTEAPPSGRITNWYAEKYQAAENNAHPDTFKIENDILYHRFNKLKKPLKMNGRLVCPYLIKKK